ncbi:hypothetical protein RX880_07870 [Pseudomonas syringae pv. actinidiae]|nr:hypothetical protein [Pseudomonas syringae pv. actinidiae]MDU8099229.1 hypothetical protein [Pseudomonas syringae pv. actinidiae]MDU8115753.1 hypothetical protein [Pseudomonas syringae pv. actinidiae]MDU8131849.1 hypothetical protein [Pseudomonas syringae pv. actinidiae]MDU8153121.1 hypothetical protein [Pseudomonas syringae pv. actinidiae]
MIVHQRKDLKSQTAIVAKLIYLFYQKQGRNATNLSQDELLNRTTGFTIPLDLARITPYKKNMDSEIYLKGLNAEIQDIYEEFTEAQERIIASKMKLKQNRIIPSKHRGMKDFDSSFQNKELEALGAFSKSEKRALVQKLTKEFFDHLTKGVGVDAILKPHCYKEPNTDCHALLPHFDKDEQIISDHNMFLRIQKSLVWIHRKYPQLIPPENLIEDYTDTSRANKILTQEQKDYISKQIVNSKALWLDDFKAEGVYLNLVTRAGKRHATDHTKREYKASKRVVKGISVEHDGHDFYSSILSVEADRKIQLMEKAEQLKSRYNYNIYEVKDKLHELANSSASYEEFSQKCLENHIKLLAHLVTRKNGKTEITGFHVNPTGIKEHIKISLFDLDLMERFSMDMKIKEDELRVLKESQIHREAYVHFSEGELKLKRGQTQAEYVEEMKQKYKDKYVTTFHHSGDEYFYKNSPVRSFEFNENSGTGVLYQTGTHDIKALAECFIKRGTTELIATNLRNKKETARIHRLFGLEGIKVKNPFITEAMESDLHSEILQMAIKRHKNDLNNLELRLAQIPFKPVAYINATPLVSASKNILSYENIWLILPKCAEMGIDLRKVPSDAFVDNHNYLKDRFKDNKIVLDYVQSRVDRHSNDLEVIRAAYLKSSKKAPKKL